MILPDYWLKRPMAELDKAAELAFDELLQTTLCVGSCPVIQFSLPSTKWQFLCYIADHYDIVLHGSGDPDIHLFEPRQAHDLNAFGNQAAVYAASDGLWPLFFAIVDRTQYKMTINNACVQLVDHDGTLHGPFYVFSINKTALALQPWRTGIVYLLPRQTFIAQPPVPFGASEIRVAQLASPLPVQPLAKLTVTPSDFPFLKHIRGHDDTRLQDYATALQTGAPWPEEP